jgi:3-hydroxyacyl-CoA dehydrogenase/enoyl-CoA hydratase/3-hydroxybutyryl-CoA epimerase
VRDVVPGDDERRGVFFATTALKKDTGVDDGAKVEVTPVQRLGILGGGLMGGGIAYVSLLQGLEVRLKDKDDEGVGRALRHVAGLLDGRVRKRAMTKIEPFFDVSRAALRPCGYSPRP